MIGFCLLSCMTLVGCPHSPTYRQFFHLETSEFNPQSQNRLTLRGKTYALTPGAAQDTIEFFKGEPFVVSATNSPIPGSWRSDIFHGTYYADPPDRGSDHAHGQQPVWYRLQACWGDTLNETRPEVTVEIDSISFEYVDEHRTRPYAWSDTRVYVDRGECHINLGSFPLDFITVSDIIDAEKANDLPRFRISFDALFKSASGELLQRQRIESLLSFARSKANLLDTIARALDE